MSYLMDLLRGPALGVVSMIFLLAGVFIVTAFAALIAQTSLLLRLKPWNTSPKPHDGERSEAGNTPRQASTEPSSPRSSPQCANAPERQGSPSEHPRRGRMVGFEPDPNEVVDAIWWQEVG